jgi:hypothetical protein
MKKLYLNFISQILLSGLDNHCLSPLDCLIGDEIIVDRLTANGNAGDLFAVTLPDNCKRRAAVGLDSDLLKEWHGDDIARVRRGKRIKTHGVEHIPRRHFSGIVHPRIGQPLLAHAVKTMHDTVEDQQYGVWQKKYNNTITGETWVYPEFCGYHADVSWVLIENRESPFAIYTADSNMYFQILRPGREKDALTNNNVEPPFPSGNIGFLRAIPSIGTKFHSAELMGPQSQKNVSDGQPVTGTLWFDFNMNRK